MFYVWITHSYEVIETDWVEEESLDDIKDSDDVNPNGAGLLDLAWVRGGTMCLPSKIAINQPI